jgi:hypothetical protein
MMDESKFILIRPRSALPFDSVLPSPKGSTKLRSGTLIRAHMGGGILA